MTQFAQFNKQITTKNLDYLNLDYLGYCAKNLSNNNYCLSSDHASVWSSFFLLIVIMTFFVNQYQVDQPD